MLLDEGCVLLHGCSLCHLSNTEASVKECRKSSDFVAASIQCCNASSVQQQGWIDAATMSGEW